MATGPLAWAFASLLVVVAAACGGSEEDLSDQEIEAVAVSSPSAPSQAAARTRPTSKSSARRNGLSHREVKAARLVEAQVGDGVTCRDNGAVNTKLRPEYPVGYICSNEDGDFYVAVVSAGVLTSLRAPCT